MGEIAIHVNRVHGKRANAAGEFLDPFTPMDLPWKEPGMVYCHIDSDSRVAPVRRREGWVVCNLQRDFLDAGCPSELIPPEWSSPDGTIRFGQLVLAKMPAAKRSAMLRRRVEKRMAKRRAVEESVYSAGERAAHPAVQRGILPRGTNLVFDPNKERS